MTEQLFQFIWQFGYFNKGELLTTRGEPVQILQPGHLNTNQGPDFLHARIRIGKAVWAGSVEIHIRASDWDRHQHGTDSNYENVILHVVWENDRPIQYPVPVLELKGRVSLLVMRRYEELMCSPAFIPCGNAVGTVKPITWKSWKERLVAERLIRKAGMVESYLQQNNFHWEETFWWMLARNFGMKVNADAFEVMARSIPLTVLAKSRNQIHQVESLLMGQAGLFRNRFREAYPRLLKKEYHFQCRKHQLRPIPEPVFFLRMRPVNFPTVRLAQLAMLIHESVHLFSKIKETNAAADVKKMMDVTANDYWHYHYRFDEESAYLPKRLGASMTDNILINTLCPVLFAYGHYHKEQIYKDKAIAWLEETAPEVNSVSKGFKTLGIESRHAFDTQALIELKKQYCDGKRCLSCAVGCALVRG